MTKWEIPIRKWKMNHNNKYEKWENEKRKMETGELKMNTNKTGNKHWEIQNGE